MEALFGFSTLPPWDSTDTYVPFAGSDDPAGGNSPKIVRELPSLISGAGTTQKF